MSAQEISEIVQRLNEASTSDLVSNGESRKAALALSRRLTALLEDPFDRSIEMVFSPCTAMGVRMAVELELFTHIQKHGSPISSEELARISGGEPSLVVRLCRLLAALDFITEVSEDLWSASPTTAAMATGPVASGNRFVWDFVITSCVKAPKFIRETGFHAPSEPTDGFVQYAFQTKLDTFGLIKTMPSLLRDFNEFMGNTMGSRAYWYDWYPVKERLLTGLDPSSALLVDIGGGKGHDVQAFLNRFPGAGRLVLQDLPQALDGIKDGELDPSIERVRYSFFDEQPEQGARAYFLHHILHDWSDKYVLRILANIRKAMKPGYSKLLIHDLILPNTGASAYQCNYDMAMMGFNSAVERSRKQWMAVLTQAGFKVVEFWLTNPDADGIVEAIVEE